MDGIIWMPTCSNSERPLEVELPHLRSPAKNTMQHSRTHLRTEPILGPCCCYICPTNAPRPTSTPRARPQTLSVLRMLASPSSFDTFPCRGSDESEGRIGRGPHDEVDGGVLDRITEPKLHFSSQSTRYISPCLSRSLNYHHSLQTTHSKTNKQ